MRNQKKKRMEISDLCIHKDILKAKAFIFAKYGIEQDMEQPIHHCKDCVGYKKDCFYYYSLNNIKRQED